MSQDRNARRSRRPRELRLTRAPRALAIAAWTSAAAIVAFGCGQAPTSVPSRGADIAGRVTTITPGGEWIGTVRVEAVPADTSGSPKADVRVGPGTTIVGPDQHNLDFSGMAVGQWVRVWYSGPVAESYPVQAGAATVVIDSTAR
jgi:hypothetical protein